MTEGRGDFDLVALHEALDEKRAARDLSWAAATRELNASGAVHPIATSTLRSLGSKQLAEGDGVLQMLRWLGRSPESFVPGVEGADGPRYQLPKVSGDRILRWNTQKLHAALQARKEEEGLSWREVASQVGGFTPPMLTRLRQGGRTHLPGVMRVVGWLERPAADFVRGSEW